MEQQILQKLHTNLLRMLPGQDLAPVFFQNGLLTQAEYDQLHTKASANDKNLHILACLGRRPHGMLDDLISCLEKQTAVPGVKEILQDLKEKKSEYGDVRGPSPIGSAVDPSSSEGHASADEIEQPSDPDCSDFEEISPPNWSTPELPSEFKPKLQQREVLAPEEKVVLPNYGLPVKSQSLGIATKIVHGVQHGLQHIFDSSSADHGSCYLEFRKKKKTPTDYFSAFRVALGFLQVLRQHQKIGASVDFSEFSMSLEKRSVSIAITGRNNAGKTTLINAMVGNRILPVHRRPETAVRVYLRHRETCAMTGPELTESFGNEMCQTVACGREYVLQYIRGRNEEVRSYQTKRDRQQQIMKDEKLILHLNMPLLCSKSRVQIVDTPGFAALDQPHLDDAAGRVLRGSAAYILLISYHQLSNSGDLSILDQLKLLDRAVSSDRRLIIAVTQHDISYTQSSDAEMSPSETIQFVSEIFKGLSHHDITEDQIIPVSGKWALTARMLKKDPSNDTYLKEARRALTDYRESQACGQDYRSSSLSDVQQMDAEAIADALEKASNIAALESSIAKVIEQCDSVVCKSASSKVHYWLKEAMKELGDDLMEKQTQYKTTRAKVAHIQHCLKIIHDKKRELQNTVTGKDSKVYQLLLHKYTHEAEKPCAKVKELIPRHLTILKETCREDCRRAMSQIKGPYSTCRLNDGINRFVKEILSPAVQDVVKDGCIEQTRQVCKAYVSTYVPDQFRVMKDAACDLPTHKKNKTWKPQGATLDSVIGEIKDSLILERFLKEHRLEAPEVIEWNWWDKFKAAIRVFLNVPDHGDPDTVKEALLSSGPDMDKIPVSPEDIERMFDALTDFLLKRSDQYFFGDDGIQKVVVEGFHAEYSRWVKEGLSSFENAFGEMIRMEQDNVKKMTQRLKALETEIDELNYFCEELQEIRKDCFLVSS